MAAWVNVTWPTQLAYVSDDANAIGGVRNGNGSIAFTSVATGSYVFNMTAAPPSGWPNGTIAVTRFSFEATDHNGVLATRSNQDVFTTFRNARLTVTLAWIPPSVNPGELILGNITLENVGAEPATNVAIEASVDPNASYDSSSAPGTYDILSRIVRWLLGSVAVGSRFQVAWTVRTAAGTPDRATVATVGRASYQDEVGAAMPAVTQSASSQVRVPVINPALVLDRGSAERGDVVAATLYYNNTGTGVAGSVWANWSLSGYYQLVDVFPSVPFTPTAVGFSFAWANVSPGAYALLARLRVVRGLADGLAMNLAVTLNAQDGNGNALPGRVVAASVALVAPAVSLVLAAPEGRVDLGSDFALELTIANGGGPNAIAWLNLTLPPGVTYVGDNGTWPVVVEGSQVMWSIANLPGGSTQVLSLRVHGGGAARTASFRFAVNYTDGRGSPPTNAVSNAVSVELVPLAGSSAALWLIIAAGAAIAVAFLVRRGRSRARVEDAFVVDNNGILLAHRSAGLIPYGDDDVLVGMFTTVQQFVKDAFARGSSDQMRSLQFGERTILIERGSYHYVAIVFKGKDRGEVAKRLQRVSEEVEKRYGVAFASWTGDLDAVRGISQILAHAWGTDGRPDAG